MHGRLNRSQGVTRRASQLECYGTSVFVLAVMFVFLYAFGIPLAGFFLLYRSRTRLYEPRFKQKLGFLYGECVLLKYLAPLLA